MSDNISEVNARLQEYIRQNAKNNMEIYLRFTKIEARLKEIPSTNFSKEQFDEASKEEVTRIEARMDEIAGEMAKIKDLNTDRLAKIETKLNEFPKQQFDEFVTKLIKNLENLLELVRLEP